MASRHSDVKHMRYVGDLPSDLLISKGDLLTFDSSSVTPIRVRTNGQVLTTNSSGPTGLKWQTAPRGGIGDVVGPANSADYALTVYNGDTGKVLRNSILTTNNFGHLYVQSLLNLGPHVPSIRLDASTQTVLQITDSATQSITLTLTGGSLAGISSVGNALGSISLNPSTTVEFNSKSLNLGNNDAHLRRSDPNNVMLDRNGSGTGAVNLSLNGSTLIATNLSNGSAFVTTLGDAITLTTGSNQNITLSPNGIGIVVLNKALTVPAGTAISFGTNGKIANSSPNSFAFTTNAGVIPGIALGIDRLYASTFVDQVSGLNVFSTYSGGINFASGKCIKLNGATSGTVGLLASSTTTSYNMTLPPAQGANGQFMINNGSGALSWSSVPKSTVTTNTRTGITATYSGTSDVSWTALTDKIRLVNITNSATFTAGANGYATFHVDSDANFGDLTEQVFSTVVFKNGVEVAGRVRVRSVGLDVYIDIGPVGGYVNAEPDNSFPGFMCVVMLN